MTPFEATIVKCSKNPIAGLYDAAQKAAENPARGIEIKNKTAFYVIRDCAKCALKWLPLELLLEFSDPKSILSKKATKDELTEFVQRALSKTDAPASQTLKFLLESLKYAAHAIQDAPMNYEPDVDLSNVYGEYSTISSDKTVTKPLKINDDEKQIIEFLVAELM